MGPGPVVPCNCRGINTGASDRIEKLAVVYGDRLYPKYPFCFCLLRARSQASPRRAGIESWAAPRTLSLALCFALSPRASATTTHNQDSMAEAQRTIWAEKLTTHCQGTAMT